MTKILGDDDDVIIELCYNLLESSRYPDIKNLQIQLTGFLEKDAPDFCEKLWKLALSAQESPLGVPKELLEAKKQELRQNKVCIKDTTTTYITDTHSRPRLRKLLQIYGGSETKNEPEKPTSTAFGNENETTVDEIVDPISTETAIHLVNLLLRPDNDVNHHSEVEAEEIHGSLVAEVEMIVTGVHRPSPEAHRPRK